MDNVQVDAHVVKRGRKGKTTSQLFPTLRATYQKDPQLLFQGSARVNHKAKLETTTSISSKTKICRVMGHEGRCKDDHAIGAHKPLPSPEHLLSMARSFAKRRRTARSSRISSSGEGPAGWSGDCSGSTGINFSPPVT